MEIPDHLTCLMRNLYAGQEATVRTGCGTMDWFKIWKGLHQTCILSLWLFNLHAEFSSVQFSSVAQSCPTLFDPMNCSMPSLPITISWSSLRLTSIESVMPSSHLILCCPLFLLPPIPPIIRVFSNESTLLMRWPKYSKPL